MGGGVLLNTSIYYPNCDIVYIDLSLKNFIKNKKIIEDLELKNVKLYNMDILDYDDKLGLFDYIICHDIYSYVNEDIKNKLLEIIKKSLNKNGVACVSYNVYPGFKTEDVLNDFLKFNMEIFEKTEKNINLEYKLKIIKENLKKLKNETKINTLKSKIDNFLQYDLDMLYKIMNLDSNPVYFSEFINKIEKYDFTYLLDAKLTNSFPILRNDILDMIVKESNNTQYINEQYYDLIYNNDFRMSIIAHKDDFSINYNFNKEILDRMYLRSNIKLNEIMDKKIQMTEEFLKILKILNDKYPNNISIKELNELLDKEIYYEVLILILNSLVEISGERIDVKLIDKIKLNERIKKIFEGAIKNYKKIKISINNKDNLSFLDLKIILLFDGTKSINDIIEYMITFVEEHNLKIKEEKLIEKILNLNLEISNINGCEV